MPLNLKAFKTKYFQKTPSNFIFFAAILIIIIIGFASIFQFYNLMHAYYWVTHTNKTLSTAHDALYQITNLESKQRGYLLFGDKKTVSDYTTDVLNIKKSYAALFGLTKDNPSQQARILELTNLTDQRINILYQMIQLKENNKLYSPATYNAYQEGKILSDEIKMCFQTIMESEFDLLEKRNISALKSARFSNLIFIGGQIISILFLLIAFWLFNRELSRRRKANIAIKNIESELRSIINGANDMIAALDLNYRFIIFNQAYKKEFSNLFKKNIAIGMSLDDAFENSPEAKHKSKELWKLTFEGKKFTRNIEFDVNNKKHIFEVTSGIIKNHQNEIVGGIHIQRNVTERIEKENALAKAKDELQNKNNKITLLLEMSDIMLACSSVKEVSEIIVKYCEKILNFGSGILYIMNSSKNFLELSKPWGSPTSQTASFLPDECWALRLGHVYYTSTSDNELLCKHITVVEKKLSYLCIPLSANNEIYGLLYIEIQQKEKHLKILRKNETLFINAIAEIAALAFANVRLRENLSYQSIRDPLTSLYNRRYLNEFLLKLIYQSDRAHRPIAVLMLDFDHFKRINDIHGHEAGDIVLKEVGQLLSNDVRSGDVISRYGGEEFIIVLYNTDTQMAVKRAENIRESILQLHLTYGAQEIGKITVSIGVAIFPEDGKTSMELIEAADKALYIAKNRGRNKVILFSEI